MDKYRHKYVTLNCNWLSTRFRSYNFLFTNNIPVSHCRIWAMAIHSFVQKVETDVTNSVSFLHQFLAFPSGCFYVM